MFNSELINEKAKILLEDRPQVKNLFEKIIPAVVDNGILGHVLFICPDMRLSELFIQILREKYNRNIRTTDINIKTSDMGAVMTSLGEGEIWAINNTSIDIKTDALESLKKALYLYCIDIIIGKGPGAQSIRLNLPYFTFVSNVK